MSRLPELIGHEECMRRLRDAAQRDRLAHSLLFLGAEGIGKSLAAHHLAADLQCTATTTGRACGTCDACAQVAAESHPDLMIVRVPEGRREIGIDQIRRVRRFAQMRATSSRWRVILFPQAERMTVAAQNGLLKTLEEPGERTLLVLVTPALGTLLSTIRSRCQRVRFAPLRPDQVRQVLMATEGLDAQEAAAQAAAAEGSPGRARERSETIDPEQRERLHALLAELHPYRYGSVVRLASELSGNEREMRSRLEQMRSWFRNAAAPESTAAGIDVAPEQAVAAARVLSRALHQLRYRNPNRPLLAESTALQVARVIVR